MTDILKISCLFEKFSPREQVITFNPGLHVVYGESGSGKTNFIRTLASLNPHGMTNYAINIISIPDPVQIILQNPDNQIISNSIYKELAFSLECFHHDSDIIQQKLEVLKQQLPFKPDLQRHPATLSGGEKELLNIVTAFSTPAKLILIDDGLACLSQDYKNNILEFIQEEILRTQKIVLWFSSDYADLDITPLSWELSLSGFYHNESKMDYLYPDNKKPPGHLIVKWENLSFGYHPNNLIFENLNTITEKTRSCGIIGDSGSGKSTLAALMLELYKPSTGMIELKINNNDNLRIGYLDQFPERVLGLNTFEDLVKKLENSDQLTPAGKMNFQLELTNQQINWKRLKRMPIPDIPWSTLRFVLTFLLSFCDYDLLILDEPTFGLGWKQKRSLHKFLHRLMEEKHFIIISHDIDFIKKACDQIISVDGCIVRQEKKGIL